MEEEVDSGHAERILGAVEQVVEADELFHSVELHAAHGSSRTFAAPELFGLALVVGLFENFAWEQYFPERDLALLEESL